MLYNILDKNEFNKTLLELVEHNKEKYALADDYVEGKHWASPGVLTRNGKYAIDERDPSKKYSGIIINLIKDAFDTVTSLVYGTNGVIATPSELVNIDWEDITDEIVENGLKYDKAYVQISRDIMDKATLCVIDTDKILIQKDDAGQVIEVNKVICLDEDKKIYRVYSYRSYGVRVFQDGELELEEERQFIPIFEISLDFDYITSLIELNDTINLLATQEFEINKYQADPLTYVSGMEIMIDDKGREISKKDIKVGAGQILFVGENGEVGRVDSKGVTSQFVESLNNYVRHFYKQAKLNGLKNEDIGSVTSGYAIQLKLIDTINFVSKIRGRIITGLMPVFNIISTLTGEEYMIKFSDVIQTNNSEKLDEAKKMKELGISDEYIAQFLGIDEKFIVKNQENQ